MQAPGSRRVRTAEAMGGSSRHRLAARTKVRKPTASAPGVVGGVVVVTPGALAGHTTQPTQAPTGHPAVGCQPGRLWWLFPVPCPALPWLPLRSLPAMECASCALARLACPPPPSKRIFVPPVRPPYLGELAGWEERRLRISIHGAPPRCAYLSTCLVVSCGEPAWRTQLPGGDDPVIPARRLLPSSRRRDNSLRIATIRGRLGLCCN